MPGTGLPTGTVAFVFTDIEGSTRLAQAQPRAFASLLQRHSQLLRTAFASGAEAGTAGDALFVAFSSVGDALAAAAEGQRLLAAEPWPGGVEIRVRMGVHVGVAEVAEDTYMGVEVHRAARICAAAHGGQVLVSQAAAALQGSSPQLSLRSLGDYRLKDFDDPQELYQLGVEGLPDAFPPPRTAEARVVSLPREATSLVGRDRELAEIRALVMDNRLTTLTGTGGSGKSRLAMRVARDLAPRFRGPVVLVSLAPLADADSAPASLASALGLTGMFSTWADAAEVLRPQNALIVWDNAEHLPGFDRRLQELRDDCDRLHCLVTSRSPLGAVGEQLYPVGPLTLDAALDLLVERARRFQPRFDPVAVETELRSIAGRLDGLPLALELAAARLRSLPAPALLERLDHLLDVLGEPTGDQAGRQATIRTTLQWSYDLLGEAEQTMFAALSLFAGPARLEAIARAAGSDDITALNSVTRLIDASLVNLHDADEPRYWMLEPTRQFAAEQLARTGWLSAARKAMLAWYVDASVALVDEDERSVRMFRPERDNLLRALDYSVEEHEWDAGVTLAYHVSGGVFGVGGDSGALVEWVRDMELREPALSPGSRARLALLNVSRGYPEEERLLRAIERADACGDPQLRLVALVDSAERWFDAGELDTAERMFEEAADLGAEPLWFRINLPQYRAMLADARGQRSIAEAQWQIAEQAARAAGDAVHLVRTLWNIAGSLIAHGEGTRALALLEEALEQDSSWESWAGTELALRQSAGVAAVLAGRLPLAAKHLQRALVIFDRVWAGDRFADLPVVILTVSAALALSGRDEACATLFAWAAPLLPERPTFDRFAVRLQRELVANSPAGGRPVDPGAAQLDRQQVLRLSLDEVATALERG